jgi:hypothetical protein
MESSDRRVIEVEALGEVCGLAMTPEPLRHRCVPTVD